MIESLGVPTAIDAIGSGESVVVVAKLELVDLLQRHLRDHHGMVRVAQVLGSVGEDKPGERARRIVAVRFRPVGP
jgi:hypothetical protein